MVRFKFSMDFYKVYACDCLLIFIMVLVVIIQSETVLMQGIIPEKQQRQIFEQLIQGALDQVVKDGEVGLIISIHKGHL